MFSLLILLAAALYVLACAVTCFSIFYAPDGQETEEGFVYSQSNRKRAEGVTGHSRPQEA